MAKLTEATDWSLFKRYPIEVSARWLRKVEKLYPSLVLDHRDDVAYDLGIPSGWKVQLRYEGNLSPEELDDEMLAIDVFDEYIKYNNTFKAVLWVPRSFQRRYPKLLKRWNAERKFWEAQVFHRILPQNMVWDTDNKCWRLMTKLNGYMGYNIIGTPAFSCRELRAAKDGEDF